MGSIGELPRIRVSQRNPNSLPWWLWIFAFSLALVDVMAGSLA
jgi:hypothetical protein